MATLELDGDEVLVLKAAWEFFIEDDNHTESMAEALEISNEERNMDEDGEYVEGKDEGDDPVENRVAMLGQKIMSL